MNEEHKSEQQIIDEIQSARIKIEVDATYVHYKDPGRTYIVRGFAIFEATNELCVIYQAEYGKKITFVRPVSVWLDTVEWRGEKVPRFTKILHLPTGRAG